MGANQLPDTAMCAKAQHGGNGGNHAGEFVKRPIRQLFESDGIDFFGSRKQVLIAVHIVWCDTPDLRKRFCNRAAIIEGTAVFIDEAVPGLHRHQLSMVTQVLAKEFEKFFKQERCGEDRGAGIMAKAFAFKHLRASAKLGCAVDESDSPAFGPCA